MTRKSVQTTASTRSGTSHLFASHRGKDPVRNRTRESIAADIAAFKKRGGRIEVLGVTPFRPYSVGSAFRSRGNTPRKASAADSGKAATQREGKARRGRSSPLARRWDARLRRGVPCYVLTSGSGA